MPRSARKISESGIYHVMVRGIDRCQLFYDDEDRNMFLDRLARYKKQLNFLIYAWCLMGNHAHLLLGVETESLADIMRKLLLSYSHYFNSKYDRTGYLFQDRYKSKPVDDDAYFLSVLRYILRNPAEVGEGFENWSSYREYTETPFLTDVDHALSMLSENGDRAKEAFRDFILSSEGPDEKIGFGIRTHIKDREALVLIKDALGSENTGLLCELDKAKRNEIIRGLRQQGVSIRQLSRLTGVSRGVIQRAYSMRQENRPLVTHNRPPMR